MAKMPRSRKAVVEILCLAVAAAMADGCKSAQTHRKEADIAANRAIEEKQQEIGKVQPFTIETTSDTLRRQLMLMQDLPRSSDASLSRQDVDLPRNWPEKEPEKPSTQPTIIIEPVDLSEGSEDADDAMTRPATMPATMPATDPGAEASTAPGGPGFAETAATPAERIAAGESETPTASSDLARSEATVRMYSPASPAPIKITLEQALKIGAANSRQYQAQKERIFIDALALDLQRDDFRTMFAGSVDGRVINDQGRSSQRGEGQPPPETGAIGRTSFSASRTFANGVQLFSQVSFDVVKMLTGTKDSSYGMSWDASVTVPLLRGGGRDVVLEPLTQAERNLTYDLLEFEQYKREFAVNIASQYFQVLSQYDQIGNAEAAYRRAIASTRRARRQADAGRLPEIQVDQSVQQELRSRDRWISAQANLGRRLDSFKQLLGLPPDANIILDPAELAILSDRISSIVEPFTEAVEEAGKTDVAVEGPLAATVPATSPVRAEAVTPEEAIAAADISDIELPPSALQGDAAVTSFEQEAIRLALASRPDLRVANAQVQDAQRKVVVAANALKANLTLKGQGASSGSRAQLGSAGADTGNARLDEGVYTGSLLLDLPLERTAERNAYRRALIDYEAAVRALQQMEDEIKAEVRNAIRDLMLARETIQIQARSVAVAQKRVDSTNLFMEAGRAQIRDVLEAQDALVQAQNGLTSAVINYRMAELSLQRDLGLLEVNYEGLWREYEPVLGRREIEP